MHVYRDIKADDCGKKGQSLPAFRPFIRSKRTLLSGQTSSPSILSPPLQYPRTSNPVAVAKTNVFQPNSAPPLLKHISSNTVSDRDTMNDVAPHADVIKGADQVCPEMDLRTLQQLLNGYRFIEKIRDASQGAIYRAMIVPVEDDDQGSSADDIDAQYVIIKKTMKKLHNEGVAIQNGYNIVTHKNIVKEAMILHYLSTQHESLTDYVPEFVEAVESDTAYYLVMDDAGSMTLKAFCDRAFEYIRDGRLSHSNYLLMCKYIAWQMCVCLQWLHREMNTAHLDFSLEHVLISTPSPMRQELVFIEDEKSGDISVNRNIWVRLIDFGRAEVWKKRTTETLDDESEEKLFLCSKGADYCSNQYCCPQMWNEEPFDAAKADCYAFGIILFYAATGQYPYKFADADRDSGYWCLQHRVLSQYLQHSGLSKYVNDEMLPLLNGLLCPEESKRFTVIDVVRSSWLTMYYNKFKQHIELGHRSNNSNSSDSCFPFYNSK